MTTIYQFIATVYVLTTTGRWVDLAMYFSLMRELLNLPRAVVVPGEPKDKAP